MTINKLLVTIALVVTGFASYAQQDPQFSQNMWNRLAVNPGYAGSNGSMCATLLGRQQWGGFLTDAAGNSTNSGIPKTVLLSIDAPVNSLHGGLGSTIISDQIGFEKNLMAKLDYSYRLPLGPGMLGIGVEAGIISKSISGNWITPEGVSSDDKAIPQNTSDISPDFATGLYYHTPDMYVGVSSTHLSSPELKEAQIEFVRNYYLTAGYNKMVGQNVELRPSVFVKSESTTLQYDLNLNVMFKNMFWVGATYREEKINSIVAMAGFQQVLTNGSSFRIGYAYDINTASINNNTHEIMVGYCMKKFEKKTETKKRKTVRFL